MTRVGVIGAGLIGRERLVGIKQLAENGYPVEIVGVFDANHDLSRKTAGEFNTVAKSSIEELLAEAPDWVIVALPHDVAVQVARRALQSEASVLLEKPMGRDLYEARELLNEGGTRLRLGFNYRFYPGIRKVLNDARSGRFGNLISIEILLGHGCSPGQEKTWKLDKVRAGGGCLIDPGVHLLDLCLLLASDQIKIVGGTAWSGFWNTGIEEDVNLLLSSQGVTFSLQISIVRWLSELRMCVRGVDGYGLVTGRNRSYGPQTYRFGSRWGWLSAPSQSASELLEIEAHGMDVFAAETAALLFPESIDENPWPAPATAEEGFRVMELLDEIRSNIGLRRTFSEAPR